MYNYLMKFNLDQPVNRKIANQYFIELNQIALPQWVDKLNAVKYNDQLVSIRWALNQPTRGNVKIITKTLLPEEALIDLEERLITYMFDHYRFDEVLGDYEVHMLKFVKKDRLKAVMA